MKPRDAFTLIGSIMLALGPVFIQAAQNSTMWWLGMSFTAVGPVFLAGRAIHRK